MSETNANAPVKSYRIGHCFASVFENEIMTGDEPRTVLDATVTRRYRDPNEVWKSTNSFSLSDLLDMREVTDLAIDYIKSRQAEIGS